MTTENQNFTIWAGDDKDVRFFVTGITNPADVDAAEWEAEQVEGGATVITKTKAGGGITVTGATGGIYVTVALAAVDTTDKQGLYLHELELTDTGGHSETVAAGRMRVRRSLT